MRLPVLTEAYSRAYSRHEIVAGTAIARRIGAAIRVLCASELPMAGDEKSLLPPCMWVWAHRVPSSGYSIVYDFHEDRLVLRTLLCR